MYKLCITKNHKVCSQGAEVTEKPGAHNPSVRYLTKYPRTLPRDPLLERTRCSSWNQPLTGSTSVPLA